MILYSIVRIDKNLFVVMWCLFLFIEMIYIILKYANLIFLLKKIDKFKIRIKNLFFKSEFYFFFLNKIHKIYIL